MVKAVVRFIPLLSLLLVGCSTTAQREFEANKVNFTNIINNLSKCSDNSLTPEYQSLGKYVYLGEGQTPIDYYKIKDKPTKQQLEIYQKRLEASFPCFSQAIDASYTIHPLLADAIIFCKNNIRNSGVKFLDGNQSWGEFNQIRQSNNDSCFNKIREADINITSIYEAAHQRESAARAAAWQRAAASYQQQQAQQETFRQQQMLIDSQKRSTTNCNMIGNQMTCNTY